MQVRLELFHQKANVKRVVLKHDAIIGRSAECGLRIASSLVSRQHCKISILDDSVLVRDLGSSNGTFLNGSRLDPEKDYPVEPDAQLSVGGVNFTVRFDAPVAASPVVAPPPGSTVDLPGIASLRAKETESLTAEWSAAAAETPVVPPPPAQPADVAAESSTLDASGLVHAQHSPEPPTPAAPEFPQTAAPPAPEEPAIAALIVSPEVAAHDVVSAAAGDEIDPAPPELSVDEHAAPVFAFGEEVSGSEGETIHDVVDPGAVDAPLEEEPSAGPKKKKGLFSLFGLFGRKKQGRAEAGEAETVSAEADEGTVVESPEPPAESEPLPEDTLPIAAPAAVAAALDDTQTFRPAAPAEAAGPTDDDVLGFLGASAAPDDHHQKPAEGGLGDFLKNLG